MNKLIIPILIFLAGAAALGGTNVFFAATNEMEFCTSCHSMKINLEEYRHTVHYNNQSGVQATCSDCHVPKQFIPKIKAKIMAAKDVYHWVLGTIEPDELHLVSTEENGSCPDLYIPVKEGSDLCVPNYGEPYSDDMSEEANTRREAALKKFNAYRWKMANSVWDKMKASDSRECRNCHSFENMDLDSQDRSARKKHGRATEKGQTCIDCHKGIAHSEPDEPEDEDEEVDDDANTDAS
ncbi:MAG: hypothetical protein HON68_10185 [Gammaproteobacteria bacterium]|jgi:cytochrome c-type protein NapC|nr:hypothetical protein [Gammaproteobacteria bacterium]MBT3489589.1 hypothetical protein [Gammaproteobacteria bacterium]MBT3718235.1 hypothetical protein [Gammaproteobacteria bacterium]MBT3843974.1 hypothetical protein [Gammaproteobacteria bacterium]MBT3892140.1 hypothetical protein [Gammaproteobacteria bacterium]